MIVPCGYEQGRFRGIPWITISLLLVSLGFFVFTQPRQAVHAQQMASAIANTRAYFDKHPYLELDVLTAGLIFPGISEADRAEEIIEMAAGSIRPTAFFQDEVEQPELARRRDRMLQHHRGLPLYRFGHTSVES